MITLRLGFLGCLNVEPKVGICFEQTKHWRMAATPRRCRQKKRSASTAGNLAQNRWPILIGMTILYRSR
jgi:hypothetical protein